MRLAARGTRQDGGPEEEIPEEAVRAALRKKARSLHPRALVATAILVLAPLGLFG